MTSFISINLFFDVILYLHKIIKNIIAHNVTFCLQNITRNINLQKGSYYSMVVVDMNMHD